ncbi:39S ribosomal protein L42, mitochondrial [Hoplias malabaricus]|uniref:39S ribosomal protein L42, mitochondrial n=1 Tax=Hoplias malabaricus TaxID=27720 RepID=UPI0034630AA6
MASWFRVLGVTGMLSRACCSRNLGNIRVVPVFSHGISTHHEPASDQYCNVDLGVTLDKKAVVCFHSTTDIAFELTKNISRPDLRDLAEKHDLVLKSKFTDDILKDKQMPAIEELSKMFFTTKHCWLPVGEYHRRRWKRNPPKDR